MNEKPSLFSFRDVSFTWPDPDTGLVDGSVPSAPVFDAFTAELPGGFISLTGPNGSGKTTFLLLAGGRIMPDKGQIKIAGLDTRILSGVWSDKDGLPGPGQTAEIEHKRNLLCSFLYQNMEFDTSGEDSSTMGTLLEFVYIHGGHKSKDDTFYANVLKTFELEKLRGRKLDALSKGEIQRVLLSFSALYGSKVIMMDEPVFAMEHVQKERALEFFSDIYHSTGVSIVVSLHELALTRKYADTVMLFYPDRRIDLGTCDEVLTDEALEAAYGVPVAMMYDAENLTRKSMLESAQIRYES